ncbi:type II toxin-antitoxin system RelE/ParE family toxin [Candidatus Omnitrophota bacterium]
MINSLSNSRERRLYKLFLIASAQKQIRSLPKKQIPAIITAIRSLAGNPRPGNCKKLTGTANQYRLRKGSYRVIYTISDTSKEVIVFRVRHRREAYR